MSFAYMERDYPVAYSVERFLRRKSPSTTPRKSLRLRSGRQWV